MNLYEQKMPAYLAMSQGDLIAEVRAQHSVVRATWDHETEGDQPAEAEAADLLQDVANSVLFHRFGFSITFADFY